MRSNKKRAYKRPSSEDESVYTAHGTASFGEFFSPPHEAIVPTERTNSVVSTCAFIFGKGTKVGCVFTIVAVFLLPQPYFASIVKMHPTLFYRPFIIRYSVGVSIVQGFVFNKMELEGVVMLVFIIVSVLLLIIPSIMISRQPQSSAALSFSVSYKNDYGL